MNEGIDNLVAVSLHSAIEYDVVGAWERKAERGRCRWAFPPATGLRQFFSVWDTNPRCSLLSKHRLGTDSIAEAQEILVVQVADFPSGADKRTPGAGEGSGLGRSLVQAVDGLASSQIH